MYSSKAFKSDRKQHSSIWLLNRKMNLAKSTGTTETSMLECVPLGLMYFSSLHYILMINFMLFHGILTHESRVLLRGEGKTLCVKRDVTD